MFGAIVSGGAGFLGSYLVKHLLDKGYKVVSLSRRQTTHINENLECLSVDLNNENINTQQLCLKINNHFKGCSEVVFFHLAWSGASRLSDSNVNYQLKNIIGLKNVVDLCEIIKVSTLVFAGSMEEGFSKRYHSYFLENSKNKFNRHIVYATVKMMARDYLKLFIKKDNLKIKIFTNSHLMGIGDDKDSFLQYLIERMVSFPSEVIKTSDAHQVFDVISVKDAARAYEALWKNSLSNDIIIGSSSPQSLKYYILQVAQECRFDTNNIHFGSLGFNDVSLDLSDFEPSLKSVGFVYEDDFLTTVREMKNFYLNNKRWL